MSASESIQLTASVPESMDQLRLDKVAATLFAQYSRSRIQTWIKQGALTVDGEVLKSKDKVCLGQTLQINAVLTKEVDDAAAQPIGLDIIYEDDSLIVLNKPANLVVHPAAGHRDNTLLNGLLFHCPQLEQLPRAGIVHRLDKDTTGLMVVAKTLAAHNALVTQLQARTVSRQYYALVQGVVTAGATVNANLGRHPSQRQKQAVLEFGGKEAVTHYRVVEKYRAHTLVRCQLETGRTHQIRVHMAHARFPLLGDKLYGGRPKLPKAASQDLIKALQGFPRQALHAFKLGLNHPEDDQYCEWEIPIADDMQSLLAVVKQESEAYNQEM
ncbi:MAG: 23S rRNA pseudouridine(1911/1915/1917) synthase RluD [Pseudomonadales bacterium]|nr:23S rRNA pseudouridine(1911/1915/1917) synthase RluD [Pseudomonadales bacterium]